MKLFKKEMKESIEVLQERLKEKEKIIENALSYIYECENVAVIEKRNILDTNRLKKILRGENKGE